MVDCHPSESIVNLSSALVDNVSSGWQSIMSPRKECDIYIKWLSISKIKVFVYGQRWCHWSWDYDNSSLHIYVPVNLKWFFISDMNVATNLIRQKSNIFLEQIYFLISTSTKDKHIVQWAYKICSIFFQLINIHAHILDKTNTLYKYTYMYVKYHSACTWYVLSKCSYVIFSIPSYIYMYMLHRHNLIIVD